MTMTKSTRVLGSIVGATILAMLLSGCFVIPLIDNRSPFDDPGGSSNADIEAALPSIQEALQTADTDGDDWEFEAYAGSENCSGPCKLHVVAAISPAGSTSMVPAEILRTVIAAVVPAAEEAGVNITIQSSYSENGLRSDFAAAVEEIFGPESAGRWEAEEYEINEYFDFEIEARTREHADVLAAMGLD